MYSPNHDRIYQSWVFMRQLQTTSVIYDSLTMIYTLARQHADNPQATTATDFRIETRALPRGWLLVGLIRWLAPPAFDGLEGSF